MTSDNENKSWQMNKANLLTPFITNWQCMIKTMKNYYKEAKKPGGY